MRTKNFVLFLCFLVATSVLLCFFGSKRPTIQSLVTETHKHLSNFKDNLKVVEQKRLEVDQKYLDQLGFDDRPRLYPRDVWKNVTLPLVVTAVNSEQVQLAIGFIRNVRHFLPRLCVVLYTIGLGHYEADLLHSTCNSSSCFVESFSFENYPSHVKETRLHSYRPLIIQMALNQAGAVLWLDVDVRLKRPISVAPPSSGVTAWPSNHPTSALTHPKMLAYFQVSQDSFYFHRMVSASQLLVYNTAEVHRSILLPWVQCALIQDCLDPIGAQSTGCRFDKKPHYRYSGCHRYDVSALNVVLGIAFNFDDTPYTYSGKETLFRRAGDEKSNSWNELNSTSETIL